MDQTITLVVLTLLQLCRAEIPNLPPGTWFSANGVNDNFSPKPISELFTTEAPLDFSTRNPIVVLPDFSLSSEPDVNRLSSTVTTFSSTPSSSPTPSVGFSSSIIPPSSFSDTYSPPIDFSQTPSLTSQWPTEKTVFQSQTSPLQTLQRSLGPSSSLPPSDLPNFTVIYQNPAQTVRGLPATQRTTDLTQTSVIISRPVSTTTAIPITPISNETPFITSGLSDPTSRPTVTFRSTPPTTLLGSTVLRKTVKTNRPTTKLVSSVTTPSPLRVVTGSPPEPFSPNFRIHVIAPKGSITNIKINPSTTTSAPTTKRTKKPKRNSYDGCLAGCRGRKDPICAVPLSSTVIDPNTLKGFPSVCHMACHNSYKKDAYEKLIDGRCGRLRTRIISVDSRTKIQREDLKKAEYSIINTGPQAVVEFAHASTS